MRAGACVCMCVCGYVRDDKSQATQTIGGKFAGTLSGMFRIFMIKWTLG